MTDNRHYRYSKDSVTDRLEYSVIRPWVRKKSRVIDLACGDGSLLKLLRQKKDILGEGIELSFSGVKSARQKGMKVFRGRIDTKLRYPDKFFDLAICNVTIQMVTYPEKVITEMARISKKQIISFPNFGFLPNRLEMLLFGRMPRTMLVGHSWYSTGFSHQLSIADFLAFCRNNGIKIIGRRHLYPPRLLFLPQFILKFFPNLFVYTAVYLCKSIK